MFGNALAELHGMADPQATRTVEFGRYSSMKTIPANRRVTAVVYAIALLFHVVLIAVLFEATRNRPVRMTPAGSQTVGIEAWVAGPVGTSGTTPTPTLRPQAPRKPAPTHVTKVQPVPAPEDTGGAAGNANAAAGGAQAGAGSGPVRLGSGGNLTLLNKVIPVYPRMFESARIPGTVVLDAIIHPDGTIGEVRTLKATNDAFAQAAIAAVKQWRYSPLPFEAIVTVTVNFTIPR